jgi:DNA-directed RNA polymerase sigma subunit (sigma70/sigma32)
MYFGIGMQAKHSLEQIGIQFSMARKDVQEILHKALQELEHRSVYNELTGALANTDLKDMQG